jgi:hypothetical protein
MDTHVCAQLQAARSPRTSFLRVPPCHYADIFAKWNPRSYVICTSSRNLTLLTLLDPSASHTQELNVSATTSSEKIVKSLQTKSTTLYISLKILILSVQACFTQYSSLSELCYVTKQLALKPSTCVPSTIGINTQFRRHPHIQDTLKLILHYRVHQVFCSIYSVHCPLLPALILILKATTILRPCTHLHYRSNELSTTDLLWGSITSKDD